ncbi:hypothetical protein [Sorangium cellulosum]|uniref:hypothetical protein n=1 Tax=Sorangium cellulosum TaxID=56 RepID=UPI0009B8B281|nr:hypothetical protein [Sorangium cellulosum]
MLDDVLLVATQVVLIDHVLDRPALGEVGRHVPLANEVSQSATTSPSSKCYRLSLLQRCHVLQAPPADIDVHRLGEHMVRLAIRKVLLEHANPLIVLLRHPELPIELLDQRQPPFDRKPEAVIRGIAERQDQLSALEARLRAAKAAPSALDLEVRRLEKEARQRLGDLRAMLERNPEEARKALETLETLLGGPLRFTPIETPEGKRYRIEGVVALEAVVAVEGSEARAVQAASPAGFEPA